MPYNRSRSFDRRVTVNGSILINTKLYPQTGRPGKWGTCADRVGDHENDNLLDIRKYTRRFSCATGTYYAYPVRRTITNCPLTYSSTVNIPDPSAQFSMPSTQTFIDAVSRMNPSAPKILLPAFLGELRDLPQMLSQLPLLIRGWGRHLVKPRKVSRRIQNAGTLRKVLQDGGSSYLGWQFGWAPFIGDLSCLLNILEDIVRRLQWMLQLQGGGSIKRRVLLPPERLIDELGSVPMHTNQFTVYGNHVRVFRARSWITSRWVPLLPSMYRGAILGDLFERARRQALGLTTWGALTSWWELLPWSWLTDWFVNVGQKLTLMDNSMLLKVASVCWCRTSEVDGYFYVTAKSSWISLEGTDYFYGSRKQRVPLSGTDYLKDPPPSLPALTGRQMGILGALFASRV